MIPLESQDIAARRRPGAILFAWIFRLISAWLVVVPIASAIASTHLSAFPRGDALLFDPGGLFLVETIREGSLALRTALSSSASVMLVALIVSLVIHAALLVALSHGGKLRLSDWSGRAIDHVTPFLLIGGLVLLLEGTVLAGVGFGVALARQALRERLTERGLDLVTVAVVVVGLLLLALCGILNDLGRAAVVRGRLGGFRGLGIGFRVLTRRPFAAVLGWSAPSFWGVALVAAAAIAVGRLAVERPELWRVLVVFVVHQLAVVGLISLRAWWLARALVLVSAPAAEAAEVLATPR